MNRHVRDAVVEHLQLIQGAFAQLQEENANLREKLRVENSQDEEKDPDLNRLSLEKAPLEKIVLPTDLPNLFIIPENSALNNLEKRLRFETRKEYVFRDKLLPQRQGFSVIIIAKPYGYRSLPENSALSSYIPLPGKLIARLIVHLLQSRQPALAMEPFPAEKIVYTLDSCQKEEP
jgi:hypothetical protein